MNAKRVVCHLIGHRWRRERRQQKDVIVCGRCLTVSSIEEERQRSTFGKNSWGGGGFGGGGDY
jgi:hypothetical protein